MTLPEHAICSLMLAQFTIRPRYGWRGAAIIVLAGIIPDIDVLTKLAGDEYFWKLHHALGHGLPSLLFLALTVAAGGRFLAGLRPLAPLFGWTWPRYRKNPRSHQFLPPHRTMSGWGRVRPVGLLPVWLLFHTRSRLATGGV